jgi:hypothetical protein
MYRAMIGLRGWLLIGATAMSSAVAPPAGADLATPTPVSVQVVVTPGAAGSATSGTGGAAQTGPVNVNVQVVVDSPGAVTGPVTQTNSATGGMAVPATPPTPEVKTPSTPPTPSTPATPDTQAQAPATPSTPPTPPTQQAQAQPQAPPVQPTPPVPPDTQASSTGGMTPKSASREPAAPAARHHHAVATPHGSSAPARLPLITTASATTATPAAAPEPRAQAPRPKVAKPQPERRSPWVPPAHRFADFTQDAGSAGGGGITLFIALALALLFAGPAGPGEPVAALRQRARAALGGRLEHPG